MIKIVALEAGKAFSSEAIPSITVIADSSTLSLGIEEGSVGASDTSLVNPLSTEVIFRGSEGVRINYTLAISIEDVASVA